MTNMILIVPGLKGRKIEHDVRALRTAGCVVELNPGQLFCSTPGAWEIWNTKPWRLVHRIPRLRVLLVLEN